MILPRTAPATSDVVDHYADLDRFYRDVWGEHVHHGLWAAGREDPEEAIEQLVLRVAALARLRPGEAVCDIGSGYGATARLLARRYCARVTALTLVPAQHAFALSVEEEGLRPQYLLGDWLRNSLPGESFDVAIAIESTEHMADKLGAFREICRVLRPGGRAVIAAWCAADAPSAWQMKRLLSPICTEGRLPGMASEAEHRTLLREAGLIVEEVQELTTQVQRTWSVVLGRVFRRILRDPAYRRYLTSGGRHRIFLLTAARIRLAYQVGAMRYLAFSAHRPRH